MVDPIEFWIDPATLSGAEFRDRLLALTGCNSSAIDVTVRTGPDRTRTLDGTVVVAVVSSVGAGLGALISGLLQIAREKRSGQIIFEAEGTKLSFPANTPDDRVERLVEVFRKVAPQRVTTRI